MFGGLGFQVEIDSTCCHLVQAATPAFRISKGPHWCGMASHQSVSKFCPKHSQTNWSAIPRSTNLGLGTTCDASVHQWDPSLNQVDWQTMLLRQLKGQHQFLVRHQDFATSFIFLSLKGDVCHSISGKILTICGYASKCQAQKTKQTKTNIYQHIYQQIWRFPEMGIPPVIIHFNRIFYEINHPAMESSRAPPYVTWGHRSNGSTHSAQGVFGRQAKGGKGILLASPEKNYRKAPWEIMGKSRVSCRFSLKPIHWQSWSTYITYIYIWFYM